MHIYMAQMSTWLMIFKMAQNNGKFYTNHEDNNIIYCTDQISSSISFRAIRAIRVRVRVRAIRVRVNPNSPNPNSPNPNPNPNPNSPNSPNQLIAIKE